MEENLPRAFVHVVEKQPRGGCIIGADVNRCRRNCLFHSEDEWPVYCVWDDVVATGGLPQKIEPGFYWINAPRSGRVDLQENLPEEKPSPLLRGRGFYAAPVVR